MRLLSLLILPPILLAECGEPTPVDPGAPVEVIVGCDEVICLGADMVGSTISGSTGATTFTCTWLCSEYEGEPEQYVFMEFVQPEGGCYAPTYTYTDEGMMCPEEE